MSEPTDSKSIKMDFLTNQLDDTKRDITQNLQTLKPKFLKHKIFNVNQHIRTWDIEELILYKQELQYININK